MRENRKDIEDLTTIISSAMHRRTEIDRMLSKKKEIIENVSAMLRENAIDRDSLLNYADSLLMISEWEKSERKLIGSLESKLIVILIYKLLGDEEHLETAVNSFNNILNEVREEALAWKDFDRAFLLEVFDLLKNLILQGTEARIKEISYMPKVYPLIRDMPDLLVSVLKEERSVTDLTDAFNRYENFAEKNNLLEEWKTIKRIFGLIQVYSRMRGAVTDEENDDSAEH